MRIIIKQDVENCRDCYYVDNSNRRHDCAFTGAPHPTRWYCTHTKGPQFLRDENEIDDKCPFNKTKNKKGKINEHTE